MAIRWLVMAGWSAAVWRWGRSAAGARWLGRWMALALEFSMLGQLVCLHADGLLSLETALPLHLCGLFGVLSIPLLLRPSAVLYEASAYLAAPAALLALVFPAVIPSSQPFWMQLCFDQLHVLIVLVPFLLWRTGKPLPADPRRTLILGGGYLLFVSAFNRAFETNYLFLRFAPRGTPLEWLSARGMGFYVCSLVLLAMLIFSWLKSLYAALNHCRK